MAITYGNGILCHQPPPEAFTDSTIKKKLPVIIELLKHNTENIFNLLL
jgi:hypothetical protein